MEIFVGRASCGCILAALDPNRMDGRDVMRELRSWKRHGLTTERVTGEGHTMSVQVGGCTHASPADTGG